MQTVYLAEISLTLVLSTLTLASIHFPLELEAPFSKTGFNF
jgi:hypothetical protein